MSRVKGVGSVRALLRKLPDAGRDEMIVELNVTGRDMAAEMRGRAPIRTGATREKIEYKVYPRSLKLLVGLLSTPKGRAKVFYARIQDLGRAAQTVTVTRFHKGAARTTFRGRKFGETSTYAMNVRAMPGKHFITGRYPELRRRLGDNLRNIWDRALRRSATGGGEE